MAASLDDRVDRPECSAPSLRACRNLARNSRHNYDKSSTIEVLIAQDGPFVVNTSREWKLGCPKEGGLVFPMSTGRIQHHANMLRALAPVMIKAGLKDKHGEPKYALHAFRHFYASWCINRKEDGGLGLPVRLCRNGWGIPRS